MFRRWRVSYVCQGRAYKPDAIIGGDRREDYSILKAGVDATRERFGGYHRLGASNQPEMISTVNASISSKPNPISFTFCRS